MKLFQEEYEKIQANVRDETVKRIEEERKLNSQHISLVAKSSIVGANQPLKRSKTKSPARSPHQSTGRPSQLEISGDGWTPEPLKQRQIFDSSDPLQEQIVAIKGYLLPIAFVFASSFPACTYSCFLPSGTSNKRQSQAGWTMWEFWNTV